MTGLRRPRPIHKATFKKLLAELRRLQADAVSRHRRLEAGAYQRAIRLVKDFRDGQALGPEPEEYGEDE